MPGWNDLRPYMLSLSEYNTSVVRWSCIIGQERLLTFSSITSSLRRACSIPLDIHSSRGPCLFICGFVSLGVLSCLVGSVCHRVLIPSTYKQRFSRNKRLSGFHLLAQSVFKTLRP